MTSWKSIGSGKLDNGSPDGYEFYNISQDSILGIGHPQAHPLSIHESEDLLKSFALHARDIAALILSCLDSHLHLPSGTLAQFHNIDEPSQTTVRLFHAPPQPACDCVGYTPAKLLFAHTDNGTVTILFNVLGGLQVLPPGLSPTEESNWRYIRPEPNFAIVNVGDALCQWSGGLLRSGVHRVISPPGRQAQNPRLSFAYVVKPSNGASMKRLVNGEEREEKDDQCSYEEWLLVKSRATWEGKNVVRIGDSLENGK